MSQLDPATIAKTAALAQLEISETDLPRLAQELGQIFELFNTINTPEISALAPLSHPLELSQPLRPDVAEPRDMLASLAENGPDFADGFIKVPKVIE